MTSSLGRIEDLPAEVAPNHRHTASAVRFVIEVRMGTTGDAPAYLFMVDDARLQPRMGIYQVFDKPSQGDDA